MSSWAGVTSRSRRACSKRSNDDRTPRSLVTTSDIKTEGRTIIARVTTLGEVEKVRDGNGPEYLEELGPTSVTRSLRDNPEVPAYVTHGHLSGDLAIGTARLRKVGADVIAEIYVVRSKRGDDLLTMARAGRITTVSAGFVVNKSERRGKVRVYTDVTVKEISLVAPGARAQHKSARVLEVRAVPTTTKEVGSMAPRPNQGLSKTLGATVTEDEYEAFQALAEGRGGASKALRSLVRAELHAGAHVTVGEYLKRATTRGRATRPRSYCCGLLPNRERATLPGCFPCRLSVRSSVSWTTRVRW